MGLNRSGDRIGRVWAEVETGLGGFGLTWRQYWEGLGLSVDSVGRVCFDLETVLGGFGLKWRQYWDGLVDMETGLGWLRHRRR